MKLVQNLVSLITYTPACFNVLFYRQITFLFIYLTLTFFSKRAIQIHAKKKIDWPSLCREIDQLAAKTSR